MTTGVLVAVEAHTSMETAARIRCDLEDRFPGVTLAIVAGGMSSIAFEWHPPSQVIQWEEPPPPPANHGRTIRGEQQDALDLAVSEMYRHFKRLLNDDLFEARYSDQGGCSGCYQALYDYEKAAGIA